MGTFNYQMKKTVQYWNDFKYEGTSHLLFGHSNFNWNRQFSIEIITKMTEPYILCREIQIPTEKTVQYQNDIKDHSTLHPLWGHSSFNGKEKQFSIEMISKMTEPCILCGDIQIRTEKSLQHRNGFNYKELYILCGDIQISTEKHRLLLKWLQRWQTLTFFVGTFKFQMKEAYTFHWDI